jgi:hypothetical protein
MSKRYPGGVISATPPTTSTTAATGIWTEQSMFQAVGAGAWPGKPGAPTIGTATGGNATASVTFTAPASAGGSPITSYTVTSSPGSVTASGASSPITVTGLTNGTAYTFTVTATNAQGTGPASAASNSVTPAAPVYVEDVFSTYLYTGTGANLTITNGIDLSTKGGLTWIKSRSDVSDNLLFDTSRGTGNFLSSNLSSGASTNANTLTAFNTTGFSLGDDSGNWGSNISGSTYASWAFREQPKFFDVVTYTGDGVAGRTVAHNLGVVPGCILVKRISGGGNWRMYHQSLGATYSLQLNTTAAATTLGGIWDNTEPTSTVFSVGANTNVNGNGETYVAYLFAHNAGGFGLTGTDNVISCGTFTTDGSGNATVSLGYEPQWVLNKTSSSADNWTIADNMRGFSVTNEQRLYANLSNAEAAATTFRPTATGYTVNGGEVSKTYIYIAIRRGLMAAPTLGTSVFNAQTYAGNSASNRFLTTNTVVDTNFITTTNSSVGYRCWSPRLTLGFLESNDDGNPYWNLYDWTSFASNVGFSMPSAYSYSNSSGSNYVTYSFSRAASFHDVVYYTGTGSGVRQDHNLTVRPELIIIKNRSASQNWVTVWLSPDATNSYNSLSLNTTSAYSNPDGNNLSAWVRANDFYTGYLRNSSGQTPTNSGNTFIAYLFATCAGVSKVGSYTGTGALQTVDCGFTTGARFIMIKRIDTTGDWYFYDSARGITSGNDPYMFMNATGTNVTSTNYVDSTGVGFQVTAAAPAGINASGGTYIFLAIA